MDATATRRKTPVAKLRINADGLRLQALEKHGIHTDTALADLIGIHQSNIGRVLRGEAKPSNEFIARVIATFGWAAGPAVFVMDGDD